MQVVEKGWMCLQGGWEVGGSNSSVDLYALTGWVPEIVSLREYVFSLPLFFPLRGFAGGLRCKI